MIRAKAYVHKYCGMFWYSDSGSEGHGFESHRGHYYLLLFIAVRKKKVLLAYEHTTRPTDEGNDKLR